MQDDRESCTKAARVEVELADKSFANVLFFPTCSAAKMQDEVSDAMLKEVCITEQTQYYFENNQLSFSGNIDCENCTR